MGNELSAIEWSSAMSVGVKEIDEQHKYFVGIINELYESIVTRKTEGTIDSIVGKLVDYAGVHFETEEKYFDLCHYENSEEHKNEHKKLFAKVEAFSKNKDNNSQAGELLEFLEDWLIDHFENQDKKYKKCFKACGIS